MIERRGQQPVRLDHLPPALAAANAHRLALEVGQRRVDGHAMRLASLVAARSSSAIPNTTLTLFGAENVRSKPGTFRFGGG